jgi:CRISPR system subtype II-B RNA-guided endonuclease Cas9/Csx12
MAEVFFSVVAIDMGGKHTGSISFTAKGIPSSEEINASIIEMTENGKGINYTVKDRTSVRHHKRAVDRFKKARKLIYSLLECATKRTLQLDEKNAISSLMKRRGYTRLESELDLSPLDEVSPDFFASAYPNLFTDSESLITQFKKNCCDLNSATKYFNALKDNLLDAYLENAGKNEKKRYENALKTMKEAANLIIQQEKFGHKHRKIYLKNIRSDIEKDSRLKDLRTLFNGGENLFRCIGNISNLQLRALRWYFNDISMKNTVKPFDENRFKDIWIRAYQFFHYPSREEGLNISTLIKKIRESKNIIETLCSVDPVLTIPPYEDQNNRHPPIDQTLLLSPKLLDESFSNKWLRWAHAFADDYPLLTDALDNIISTTDRKSRFDKSQSNHYSFEKVKYAYVLQRLLDLTKATRVISNIRGWSKDPDSSRWANVDELIRNKVGEQDRDLFLKFTQSYYKECELSKKGLWSIVNKPLLEMSGIHPKMKSAILDLLVASVLGINSDFNFEKFKKIWVTPFKGKSSVRSLCRSIEEKRKSYGNAFNHKYKAALYLLKKNGEKSLNKEQKELVNIASVTKEVSDYLGKELLLNKLSLDSMKFENPYSLSQLYNIMETDIHGFSSNCISVIKENDWRMQFSEDGSAICCRLPTESVRPFDGSLGKILERQAYEIAKRKAIELKSIPDIKNSIINLGILVESNEFEFSASIAQIKKTAASRKIKKRTDEFLKEQLKNWQNKDARIKGASRNICPYTGVHLENNICEIDHIIPRSLTKAQMGAIFNSEANLIYVSQDGNQIKKEREYTINNLHPAYLQQVFGTSNHDDIRNEIIQVVSELENSNPRLIFDLMTQHEQDCCRHALFLPGTSAYFTVISAMAKQYSTRVNGTQSWFIRSIISKLKNELSQWQIETNNVLNFDAWKIDSGKDVHVVRNNLGDKYSLFKKKEQQSITSHAIDALCVYAAACDNKSISNFILPKNIDITISEPEFLEKIVPTQYDIIQINRKSFSQKTAPESRQLYKDTIYGEAFVPIMKMGDEVRIGFDWGKNCIKVIKDAEKFLCLLSPFFKTKETSGTKLQTYHIDNQKAFDLFFYASSSKDISNLVKDQLECLKSLYYTTSHLDKTSIFDVNKKTFLTREKILDKKRFDIKISKPSVKGIQFDLTNQIFLPAKNEWSNLAEKFSDVLGSNNEDGLEILNGRMNLSQKEASSLQHKKAKRVSSLPIIDAPSGGVRIRRRNLDKTPIYQTVAANTPSTVLSKGFLLERKNGIAKVDWKKPITMDSYIGKNLTFSDGTPISSNDFVTMDEKRIIYRDHETIIMMSPGTEGRRNIFVEQNFEKFNECVSNIYGSYLDIDSEITLDDPKVFSTKLGIDIAGIPRGTIKISSIGKTIKYYYTVVSSNTAMNKAYDEGLSY